MGATIICRATTHLSTNHPRRKGRRDWVAPGIFQKIEGFKWHFQVKVLASPQYASKCCSSCHTFDGQSGSCPHLSTLISRVFLFQPSDLGASISAISIIQSHFNNNGWKRFPGLVWRENANNVTVCRVRPYLSNQITVAHNHLCVPARACIEHNSQRVNGSHFPCVYFKIVLL